MLYLPNADINDIIKVLNVSDSHKLYLIPDGKTGHRGVQWYVATCREKREQMAADDGQDG